MARKQNGKPPHRVGDRPGLRHKLGNEEFTRKIGDDITVTVCKEAGHVVIYLDAPRSLKIVRQVAGESG